MRILMIFRKLINFRSTLKNLSNFSDAATLVLRPYQGFFFQIFELCHFHLCLFSLGGEGHLNFGTGRYMDFIEFRWVLNIYTARAWQSARHAHAICSPSCLQWSGPRQSWSCSKQTSPSFLLTPTTFGQKTRCLGWMSRSDLRTVMLTSEVLILVTERLHQMKHKFQSGQDIITENAHFSPWESVNMYLKKIMFLHFDMCIVPLVPP